MEEQVGELWHRLITGLANDRHSQAAIRLEEVQRTVGVLFRALGGDGGLQVEAANATALRTRRSWLQRIAGSHRKVELAWRDERALRLPAGLDWFPERALNRDLYLWLAALAVSDGQPRQVDWFAHNQWLTRRTLARFPGLRGRYDRLVAAHLSLRPAPARLPAAEATREQAIRQALEEPGSRHTLPPAKGEPYPVPLWLHPAPPGGGPSAPEPAENDNTRSGPAHNSERHRRRQAERVSSPESDRGLVTMRMENILSWGEFVNVDRGVDDEEDLARAEAIAEDLDKLAVARNRRAAASCLKFDLDLPAEAEDDLVLDDGMRLPEWDWRCQRLLPDRCRIVSMVAADAEPVALPGRLARTAKRLRHQFQALAPARVWHRAQSEGQEVDIDAYLRFAADRAAGYGNSGDGLYRELRSGGRELACLLLADLSLSTDTWIDDHHRVIDIIRDSLFLFAESLAATGDRFGMFGFSSRKRDPVRVHQLKDFDESYNAGVRGRIQVIKPGYYTRLGAGIRYATGRLAIQPAERRLLLILTDGKPNDLDQYEGRYGIEDTRHAVRAARLAGLQPFCVTIDQKGNDYLPHLFGSDGYVVIGDPADLPKRLPLLYARLTS